jgi:hypothetical protein
MDAAFRARRVKRAASVLHFSIPCSIAVSIAALHFEVAIVAASAAPAGDEEYAEPERVGLVTDSRLPEVSGIVPVTGHPHCYWVHNDSGASARIFAILEVGTIIAEVKVTGAAATDWEDIAKGPPPARPGGAASKPERACLYIADTGNNDGDRKQFVIWRIREPEITGTPSGKEKTPGATGPKVAEQRIDTEPAVAIRFRYPGPTYDCEAIVVHPETRRLYLLTKELLRSHVFKIDGGVDGTGNPQVAEEVTVMSPRFMVTAADLSSDARRLALRTYVEVQEYRLPDGADFDTIFDQPRRVLPSSLLEVQGEAICYDHDGKSILTLSEAKPKVIHRIRPKAAVAPVPAPAATK